MKENKEDIFWKLLRIKLVPDKDEVNGYTEGVLFDENDIELCDTLEDTIRDINADGDLDDIGEEKIYGRTAICYDTYELTATWSPRFKRIMTLINDVTEFVGIRIHWGRTPKQTLGCLLVGRKNGEGTLANTGMTDKITNKVKKLTDAGHRVFLVIE